MSHNHAKLAAEILRLSEAKTWAEAKEEWSLYHIFELDPDEESSTCLCSHNPIRKICRIRNDENGATAEVGSSCVNKFMGLRSDLIFTALHRIIHDNTAPLNEEAIEHYHRKRLMNDFEYQFSYDTRHKQWDYLSSKQCAIRLRINRRIIASLG